MGDPRERQHKAEKRAEALRENLQRRKSQKNERIIPKTPTTSKADSEDNGYK